MVEDNLHCRSLRLIVAGSRSFNDWHLMQQKLDWLLSDRLGNKQIIEIVSGCARGADRMGERYAEMRGLKVVRFPADWTTHGRRAGMLRNHAMSKYATHLAAFWDGRSSGTRQMIEVARTEGLQVRVIDVGCGT